MKHQAESSGEFRRAGAREKGYSVSAVDSFFTRLADDYELILSGAELGKDVHTSRTVRGAVFESEKGGYAPDDVDAALDKVEDRFCELERHLYVQRYGQLAWDQAVEELRELLLGRLERPAGQRFRRPAKRLTKGYFTKEVDTLCERLLSHLKGADALTPADIRAAAFSPATGNLSYEETQVDAFLDRAIEYLKDTAQ
ncbi:MAG: DivIVA domain-containing protein [Rothia sp. (in: high G+C Gram-positive bacteria)]|uniref:DivIVA domain-containing protein n=1 Tax=Rothia sp. (in: high G+C Gram-positive bacteria) TaxID=1885016 RepID=UPI0027073BE6|nr:DivIVA domain-containing protein [Rothia sp. (in: high G+C Gram-positive bacteria)]